MHKKNCNVLGIQIFDLGLAQRWGGLHLVKNMTQFEWIWKITKAFVLYR